MSRGGGGRRAYDSDLRLVHAGRVEGSEVELRRNEDLVDLVVVASRDPVLGDGVRLVHGAEEE